MSLKKIFGYLLSVGIFSSLLNGALVNAEDEKNYLLIDMSEVANRQLFLYDENMETASFSALLNGSQALSATDLKKAEKYNKETSVLIHNDIGYFMGNPLDGKTGIHTGANSFKGAEIDIRDGYYSSFNLLACGPGYTCQTASITLKFTDGTKEELFLGDIRTYTKSEVFSVDVLTYDGTVYKDIGGLHLAELKPEKYLKKVDSVIINNPPSGDVIIGAMTAVRLTDAEMEESLTKKLAEFTENVPQDEMYDLYYAGKHLEGKGIIMKEKTGYSLLKRAYTVNSEKEFADVESVANRQLFLYDDTYKESFSSVLNGSQALSATDLVNNTSYDLKTGIIDCGGIEYFIGKNPESKTGIHTGVAGFSEKEIDVKDGFYENICVLACGVGGTVTRTLMQINYIDNTCIAVEAKNIGSYSSSERVFKVGVLNDNGTPKYNNAGGLNEIILENPMPAKKVKSITVKKPEGNVSLIVGAITFVKKSDREIYNLINESIEKKVTERESVEHAYELQKYLDELEKRGVSPAQIKDKTDYPLMEEKLSEAEKYLPGGRLLIYVSPDGNDVNEGSETSSLKSIEKAIERASFFSEKNGLIDEINIILNEGEYKADTVSELNFRYAEGECTPIFIKANGAVKIKNSFKIPYSSFKKLSSESINRFNAQVREKIVEIDLKAFGVEEISDRQFGNYQQNILPEVQISRNGKKQNVAVWPDGEAEEFYSDEVTLLNCNKLPEFEFSDDIYFGGYIEEIWKYDRVELTGVYENAVRYKNTAGISSNLDIIRGRLYNAPEFINCPGEWYIDKEKLILYYYPCDDSDIEISFDKNSIFKIQEYDNVSFSGIDFENINGNVISADKANGLLVSECGFKNIGGLAVTTNATRCDGLSISGCSFRSFENNCIRIDSGEYETLTPGGTVIENNVFEAFGIERRSYSPAIQISGVSSVINNNIIHNAPHMAIRFEGNNHIIKNNEIYNVCYEGGDVGAIYSGRDFSWLGTEICYNYIHDIRNDKVSSIVIGVYLDDGLSGTDIHHNIFKNCARGIFSHGGSYNTFSSNILIDCDNCSIKNKNALVNEEDGKVFEGLSDIYYEEYTYLSDLKGSYLTPSNNMAEGNLLVNSADIVLKVDNSNIITGTETGTYKTRDYGIFKDFEGQDYEIINEKIASALPELSKTDVSVMGDVRFDAENKFSQISVFEADGELIVSWKEVQGADYYIFTIDDVEILCHNTVAVLKKSDLRDYVACSIKAVFSGRQVTDGIENSFYVNLFNSSVIEKNKFYRDEEIVTELLDGEEYSAEVELENGNKDVWVAEFSDGRLLNVKKAQMEGNTAKADIRYKDNSEIYMFIWSSDIKPDCMSKIRLY